MQAPKNNKVASYTSVQIIVKLSDIIVQEDRKRSQKARENSDESLPKSSMIEVNLSMLHFSCLGVNVFRGFLIQRYFAFAAVLP